MRETPKTKTQLVFYLEFSLFTQKHKNDLTVDTHIWVLGARNKKRLNSRFGKRNMFLKTNSPHSKAVFRKNKFGVWCIILVRYDIVLYVGHIVLDV